jgi:hypothetical protein
MVEELCANAYRSGSESSVRRVMTSPGGLRLSFADKDSPRDSFDRLCCRSSGRSFSEASDSSAVCFCSFSFFRFRRAFSSLENPLEPAFAVSATSPACDLGLSEPDEIDARPLLRPELHMVSKSAGVVQVRLDLLKPCGSVWGTGGGSGIVGSSMRNIAECGKREGKEGTGRGADAECE